MVPKEQNCYFSSECKLVMTLTNNNVVLMTVCVWFESNDCSGG